MEEDYTPAVQHQRRVNPKIYDVIKKEVEKLLDAGLIYPISDSPWVSPVHYVPKKGGFTLVENEFDPKEINEKFPLETLSSIAVLDASAPWFADIANYHVGNFVIKGSPIPAERKFFKDCPDCEDSRARSITLHSTRVSHPQLHFGNPETDIQEKEQKKAKSKQIPARNGKDKVNPKPKTVKSQPHKENTT
ncbi:hypothetical protein Tco_1360880 [Tanacetum coccineum]